MALVPEAPSSLLCPKILGTYEKEIYKAIATEGRYDRLINIGSGEWYFAVGTLMIDPKLTAIAFDILPKARELTGKLAALNHVSNRLEVGAECSSKTVAELAKPRSLFLIDIEGAELELFKAVPPESLVAADFLIETHWVDNQSTCDFLVEYFSGTHNIEIIEQQPRDPSAFPELMELDQIDRLLAVWEGRGSDPWLSVKSIA